MVGDNMDVYMRRIDPDMKEGVITQWLKNDGEYVSKGEPIVKVEGEKVIFEIEAPESGILKILKKEGETVPVGETIAIITSQEVEKVKAIPKSEIVHKEIPEKVANIISITGMRKTIVDRLIRSYREALHVPISTEVNMLQMNNVRKILNEKIGKTPFTAILAKIVGIALEKHSIFNSTIENDIIKIWEDVNVCIAIALEDGLVAPVVRSVNKKDLKKIRGEVISLINKAKNRELTLGDLQGGTFTISNLGLYDVGFFMPIINPPQTAILGVGSIRNKPVAIEGEVKIIPIMPLTLVFDHRVADGAKAAEFLQEIKRLLESPPLKYLDI